MSGSMSKLFFFADDREYKVLRFYWMWYGLPDGWGPLILINLVFVRLNVRAARFDHAGFSVLCLLRQHSGISPTPTVQKMSLSGELFRRGVAQNRVHNTKHESLKTDRYRS